MRHARPQAGPAVTAPRALAHLDFHKDFPLDAALPLVERLAELGVSHVRTSPLLSARAGIPGRIGVVNHAVIDPEIGGESALRRLAGALHRRGMGLIADIAPGHMAAGGADNPVWQDVLEWGRDSVYANWFDIDWRSGEGHLRHKLLAPFLDRPYGAALAEGALALAFESGPGRFVLRHRNHSFPVCPLDYPRILEACHLPAASVMSTLFKGLSRLRPDLEAIRAVRRELSLQAGTAEGRRAIALSLAAFDGHEQEGRARLHDLLERQSYRLAWWRTARDELNWRCRLDAPDLVAVRVERPDVFDATHSTLLNLYAEGHIDGFSIIGWDLLADPEAYAGRLRLKLGSLAGRRPEEAPQGPAFMLADCALPPGAAMPHCADLAGSTGADAQEAIGAVLHDAVASGALSDIWMAATGDRQRFDDKYMQARREVLRQRLAPELNALARTLHDVASADLATRDLCLAALRRVIEELVIAFRVPRMNGGISGPGEGSSRQFADAMMRARHRIHPLDQPAADHVAAWLDGRTSRDLADIEISGARAGALARFEQLTAAVHLAAVEEALPRRYGRLLSRNEAGGDPTLMGLRPSGFHERMSARAGRSPLAPVATSGPAPLLGEDARMRLAVLSETPREWGELVRTLQQLTAPFRTRLMDGAAPDSCDEILLYQALLASWPLPPRAADPLALGELHDMARLWLRNTIRSAGLRTSHAFPNTDYERGCTDFLATLMEGAAGAEARQLMATLASRIAPAGALNALTQCVLKLTIPGIPALEHQRTGWDFALGSAPAAHSLPHAGGESLPPDLLLENWQDGRVKHALITRLLQARATCPALFEQADYAPLVTEGRQENNVLAFIRRHQEQELIVLVSRLAFRLLEARNPLPRIPPLRWADTAVVLPTGMHGPFEDLLSGREVDSRLGRVECSDALARSPVAVLLRKAGSR